MSVIVSIHEKFDTNLFFKNWLLNGNTGEKLIKYVSFRVDVHADSSSQESLGVVPKYSLDLVFIGF